MSDVVPFEFEGAEIRCAVERGKPLFCGADVCRGLQIEAHRRALARLPAIQKVVRLTHSLGGDQGMIWVTEGGLNTLILRSKQAVKEGTAAYRFLLKVTEDILPQIRKTGSYGVPAPVEISRRQLITMALEAEDRADAEQAKRIEAETRAQASEQVIKVIEPKAQAYDAFIESDGYYGLQNAGRAIGWRPRKFTEKIEERKVVHREGGALIPYSEHIHRGYMVVKVQTMDDGKSRPQAFFTPKGLDWIARLLGPDIQPHLPSL